MNDKIIQIMPAPAGSYIATLHSSDDEHWGEIHPAASLALVESRIEYTAETLHYVAPLGYGDSLNHFGCSRKISTLHPSEAAAKLYLAEHSRNVRLTELVSEYEAEAGFAVFDKWSEGNPNPQSASTPTSKQGEPHPPLHPECRS